MVLSTKGGFDTMALIMDVVYLGHSSFKLRGKSASVVTDPFDPKMVGLKFSPTDAEIVTISHNHNDHNQAASVENVKKIVDGPGEYEIMGVSIIGIPAYHDDKKGQVRGKNTIYIYEMDGLRLAHLGDLGHTIGEELIEQIGDIDILMIPVGGKYTIGPKDAVTVVQAIDPYIVLPMHYKMDGMNPELSTGLAPVDDFLSEVGLTVERLPKLSVKKEDLAEASPKVVLLEKK